MQNMPNAHEEWLQSLETEKEYLNATLASIGDAVLTTDTRGRISMMNLIAEDLTGWTSKEAKGKDLDEVFTIIDAKTQKEIRAPFLPVFKQRLRCGLNRNNQLVSRNGARYYISANASPIIDKHSNMSGVVIVFREINRLRRTEDALRLLSDIVEQSAAAIVVSDVRAKIEYVNPRFTSITGLTADEVVGKRFSELEFPKNMSVNLEEVWSQLQEHGQWKGEVSYTYRSGTKLWCSIYCAPLRDEDNDIAKYFVRAEDITSRKIAEENLTRAKEAAEVAGRAKAEFLTNMSHEIRTPLNAIIGMSNLSLFSNLSPDQRENLEIIQLAGNNLLRLIDDILDFSKIEAGQMRIDKICFNLPELITKNISIHSPQAQAKGLNISSLIDSSLPPMAYGDPYRITQVLSNLIGNALKFTDQGEIEVSASRKANPDGRLTVLFAVADRGIGIAREMQERIFDSFFQADGSITRNFGGTGLGLNISKKLVKMMDGEIWVQSAVGEGSTFFFTVELCECTDDGSPAQVSSEASLDNHETPALNILVVEDNQVNQLVISNLLRPHGHQVEIAGNGKEAMDKWTDNSYDLIFMDILMPEMDGLEATRLIRAKEVGTGRHIPIIALTAYAIYGDREKFLAAGMDDYLSKPVKMEDLYLAIARAMKTAREAPLRCTAVEKLRPNDLFFKVDTQFLQKMKDSAEQAELALKIGDLQILEKWVQQIKKMAFQADENMIKTLAFKVQLSARKGDIESCSFLLLKLRRELNNLSSLGT